MNNTSQFSGQPLSKKPKLDIGRQVRPNGSGSDSSGGDMIDEMFGYKAQPKPGGGKIDVSNLPRSSSQSTAGDMYDELWGDDLDSAALEKVDLEETLALSQMPEAAKFGDTRSRPSQLPSEASVNSENVRPKHLKDQFLTVKNSPRIPLRRTSSSGWPTASTLSFSATKNNSIKNTNDINSNNGDLEQILNENKLLKAQLTRKTGEVNLLRDRLHNVENDFDKQKKGYSDKMEALKVEAERNSANFSKEIRSLKGQLEVKTMEMETVERRVQHRTSMSRINSESPRSRGVPRSVFSPARVGTRQNQKEDQLMCRHGQMRANLYTFSLDLLKQLVTPELVKPSQLEPPIETSTRNTSNNPSLFSGQPSTSCHPANTCGNPSTICVQPTNTKCLTTGVERLSIGNGSRCLFYSAESNVESLKTMVGKRNSTCPSSEPCSLSLLSPRLLDINSENAHQVISQVMESCVHILTEMLQQLHVTSVSKRKHYLQRHKDTHEPVTLDLSQPVDLLCHKELYNKERGICARRALALQSLLVQVSKFAAESILPSSKTEGLENNRNGNENGPINEMKTSSSLTSPNPTSHRLLIVIRDIFHQIKTQRSRHFEGLSAAAMDLLRSLLQADILLSERSQELIVQILQGVISSRSGSLVIYYILQVLLAATKYSHVTASLCRNSDKCILQGLCMLVQLLDAPRKHVLSDLFTSWVLTLFYGKGLGSPKWLFSVPSQTSCQCRPLVSRLCLTMLGEACCMFPKANVSEKRLIEKLLNRGVLLVSTLLYHDEHFGANVDPPSEGYYELFIWSINTFLETGEIKLNEASREILESLTIQEGRREPVYTAVDSEESHRKCDTLLKSLLFDDIQYKQVLDYLDA